MDTVETLRQVSNVVTQEPVQLTVQIDPQNRLHEKLQRWLPKIFPKEKTFKIYPAKMGTLIRISNLILPIEKDLFANGTMIDASMQAIQKHAKTLCRVIAVAIHNRKSAPPEKLVELITNQFTSQAVLSVLLAVLQSMDVKNFMSSIIFMRGLNLMEMNPQTQGSQIAPGTSSEALSNIFGSA